MSESRDKMIDALRQVIVPMLRNMGFTGSFPHFRRIRETRIDLLTFQFNRSGGSFVVEVAYCSPQGFTTAWGKHIPPQKIQAHDIHPKHRLRLGSRPPEQPDHWFHYEAERETVCTDIALEVFPLLRNEAEPFWHTHQPETQPNA
jgi:hypothetical protein